jgi:phospholipase C
MKRPRRPLAFIAAAFFLVAAAGCGALAPGSIPRADRASTPAFARVAPHAVGSQPIAHVVIVIMENRSLNDLFYQFPGAYTVGSGPTHTGQMVDLQPIPLEHADDVNHKHGSWVAAYDKGKMDGFDLEGWGKKMPAFAPYAYVPRTETQPYWTMAQQYTLADEMFEPVSGPSFPAHQYLISGQSGYAIENPNDFGIWGCDSNAGTTVELLNAAGHEVNGPFPCFDYQTLGDLMDENHVSWRYYAQERSQTWEAYDAIRHIRDSGDWTKNIIKPSTQFLTDVANGELAAVSWIVPAEKESDHSGTGSTMGPSFVTSVVDAVGESKFWNSTAIFVVWDDWGGWYDPVEPVPLDRMGLGFRVPLLVISPYARPGYVSHVPHEFGSILHFAEENFGLGSLGTSDARADDLADCFDYTQAPIVFKAIQAPYSVPELRSTAETDLSTPDY